MKKIWFNLIIIFIPWILIQLILFFLLIWILASISFFFLGSILLYLIALLLFGRLYRYEIPMDDLIQNQTQPAFIPINGEDLLYSWWATQKRKMRGLLRNIPDPRSLEKKFMEKAMLVEVEGGAEYYDVYEVTKAIPFSIASNLQYFEEPFPVLFPTDFINEFQDFPINGTLNKILCPTCGGSGKVSCSWCHGSGDVSCSHCSGSGRVSSTEWVDGESKSVTESCSWCHGWGKQSCSHCSGSGKVSCSLCSGEGYLGEFIAARYEFIHWKKVHVYKETSSGTLLDAEIEDLPNEHARLINLSQNIDTSDLNPLRIPSIKDDTIKALLQKKQYFQSKIDDLKNVLFKGFSFREFPELTVIIKGKKKDFHLVGRGYKPLLEEFTVGDKYPISWVRLIALFVPFIILIFVYFFLLGIW